MTSPARKALYGFSAVALLAGVAAAQALGPQPAQEPAPALPAGPQPYRPASTAPATPVATSDSQRMVMAMEAARRRDIAGARSLMAAISDPAARKVALWALVDVNGEVLGFAEVDRARRELADFPRGARRHELAEKLLETSGQSPQQIIAWFGGKDPVTAEGAMALASAYRMTGQPQLASNLIRNFWRTKVFEAPAQRTMLSRFGDALNQDDHVRRADMLLYGPHGPATRDVVALLPADHRAVAEARMALRNNASNAIDVASSVPAHLAKHPGLAFERAGYYRRKGLTVLARNQLADGPHEPMVGAAADRIWDVRYPLILDALKNRDYRGAYTAAANSGLTSGVPAAELEFYAGWIALTKLRNAKQAEVHFANLEKIGSSPITRSKALYWLGRAAEAQGRKSEAQKHYAAAAKYNTAFYGQLAGEKVDGGRITLTADPEIKPADRARFEGRDVVKATRLLFQAGQKDTFKVFALHLDDILDNLVDQAQLIDLIRGYGDQDTSMKAARGAAQRGFVLTDRGYPMRTPPQVPGAPEPALVLGVTRQESGFDPMVRSSADARGMMQLLPSTAQTVARKMGVDYSVSRLHDPDYNMRLGSSYLGEVVGRFSGSYVLGAAAYNAGPGRPPQWMAFCGDPRTSSTDPIDFIECIPFTETRTYAMRVMEGMQVYKAKLAGGSTKITLSQDLARGGYGSPRVTAMAD
ncbi:MAG: lytic transglycosylase domain-containing protein [Phenylobacterium sp.]|uniref:lytic transglycosylase domain-containing protein n=1 Tax=Phenylobacterium sp. TaxID=1871053 RepID=UPI002A35C3DC|nr:lytic transglycosylase domain-containing protein [Phenylobacterium sp.]MDX9998472.1 lytic transglycosylase domain-containing protein [Phenylobacterium sp.]